jgi:Spy/CpxP family protein refolding chaperone
MKSRVFIGITALILLAGFAIASAESHGWHRGWRYGPMGRVTKELNLTDTQNQQIRTIWEGERPILAKLAKEFVEENRELSAITTKGTVDEAEVSRISNRQGAILAQLIVEKEHLKAKIYTDVLSPEQRDKAEALLSRWQSHIDHQVGNL